MSESINYAPFVTLGVFFLGVLFTPLLRRWDSYLLSSKNKRVLYAELSDCKEYLRAIAADHFKLLYHLEVQVDEKGNIPLIPVPIISTFDLNFLKDFYKESILLLSVDERHLVRGIPEKLNNIKNMSGDFVRDVSKDSYYNRRAVRNILWASCSLYCELRDLLNKKYKRDESLGSLESTKMALLEFGFTEEQLAAANTFKSMLSEEQRNSLNSTQNFFVP